MEKLSRQQQCTYVEVGLPGKWAQEAAAGKEGAVEEDGRRDAVVLHEEGVVAANEVQTHAAVVEGVVVVARGGTLRTDHMALTIGSQVAWSQREGNQWVTCEVLVRFLMLIRSLGSGLTLVGRVEHGHVGNVGHVVAESESASVVSSSKSESFSKLSSS